MKKLFQFTVIFVLMLNLGFSAYADNSPESGVQQATVNGHVTDKISGESLAGALVQVKGTDIKTYTDLDGNFVLDNVKPGAISIEISYISYNTNDISCLNVVAGNSNSVKILLQAK